MSGMRRSLKSEAIFSTSRRVNGTNAPVVAPRVVEDVDEELDVLVEVLERDLGATMTSGSREISAWARFTRALGSPTVYFQAKKSFTLA